MIYNPYKKQLDTKNKNETILLDALKELPQRFTDLKRITGFSDAGLNKILKRLSDNETIRQKLKNKKYFITNHGLESLKTADISHTTNRILKNGGLYYHSYSGVFQTLKTYLTLGSIRPFMYLDQSLISLKLLSTSDVHDIEKLISKKLSSSIKRNKSIEKNTGEMVLGFVIDYHDTEKILKKPKRVKKK